MLTKALFVFKPRPSVKTALLKKKTIKPCPKHNRKCNGFNGYNGNCIGFNGNDNGDY